MAALMRSRQSCPGLRDAPAIWTHWPKIKAVLLRRHNTRPKRGNVEISLEDPEGFGGRGRASVGEGIVDRPSSMVHVILPGQISTPAKTQCRLKLRKLWLFRWYCVDLMAWTILYEQQ